MDEKPTYSPNWDLLPTASMLIGTVCQTWSNLEHSTVHLLGVLSGMQRDQGTLAIVRCFAFRDQLSAIKVAATCRVKDPPLADAIIAAVDYVDTQLRPRRNRVIHDRWTEADTGKMEVHRWDMTTKIKRAQSRQRPAVVLPTPTIETIDEILRTSEEIRAYADYFDLLSHTAMEPSITRLEEMRAGRPPQPFPLRRQETPRPEDRPPPTPQPPPEP